MYLDIDSFSQEKQDEIIQNIIEILEYIITLRDDSMLTNIYNYYVLNDDYDLNIFFDDVFDKSFFDNYEIEESSITKDVLLVRLLFVPKDDNPMLDIIDVAHAIYDIDEDGDDNISTMFLTLQ